MHNTASDIHGARSSPASSAAQDAVKERLEHEHGLHNPDQVMDEPADKVLNDAVVQKLFAQNIGKRQILH